MKTSSKQVAEPKALGIEEDSDYFFASSWKLMRRKFFRHKLAIIGGSILLIFYMMSIFAHFFSPYDPFTRYPDYAETLRQRE